MGAKSTTKCCARWLYILLCFNLYWKSWSESRWLEWSAPTVSASATLELVGSRKGREEFLCEGGVKSSALLKITVQDGIPPWRVGVLRDGELFEKLQIEQQGMWVLNAFAASHIVNTTAPGVYTLGQLCDAHFCNGTVASTAIVVSVRQAPAAHLEQACSAVCLGNGTGGGAPPPRLLLSGAPPFSVTFSPLDRGDRERAQESFTRRFQIFLLGVSSLILPRIRLYIRAYHIFGSCVVGYMRL